MKRLSLVYVVALWLVGCAAVEPQTRPKSNPQLVPAQSVAPTPGLKPFITHSTDGSIILGPEKVPPLAFRDTSSYEIWPFDSWGTVLCEAAWNQKCEGLGLWEAPPAWDICKFELERATGGGFYNWYLHDVSPKSFRVYVYAEGNNQWANHIGADVTVQVVIGKFINEWATAEQRVAAGCGFPEVTVYGPGSQLHTDYDFEPTACVADPSKPGTNFGMQLCKRINRKTRAEVGIEPCGVCIKN